MATLLNHNKPLLLNHSKLFRLSKEVTAMRFRLANARIPLNRLAASIRRNMTPALRMCRHGHNKRRLRNHLARRPVYLVVR